MKKFLLRLIYLKFKEITTTFNFTLCFNFTKLQLIFVSTLIRNLRIIYNSLELLQIQRITWGIFITRLSSRLFLLFCKNVRQIWIVIVGQLEIITKIEDSLCTKWKISEKVQLRFDLPNYLTWHLLSCMAELSSGRIISRRAILITTLLRWLARGSYSNIFIAWGISNIWFGKSVVIIWPVDAIDLAFTSGLSLNDARS